MKILVDIVHPADVLFFCNPIRQWQMLGHEVLVASRDKDVTGALLDELQIGHRQISRAGRGLTGLGLELLRRDVALFSIARRFRPDVMCGFGGIAISHVGRLLSIPSLGFYDTESASLQLRLTLPFITHFYVPEVYDGPIAAGRTTRFPGTKEFSYLHPDGFRADRERALAAGFDPGRPNWFLRLVNWESNHDLGRCGWDPATLSGFAATLSSRGKLHISTERALPVELDQFRYRGTLLDVHHLLAHCNAYFGESATMASEAVLLGVPAVFAADDRRCYTDRLASAGLLWKVTQIDTHSLGDALASIQRVEASEWQRRREDYLRDKVNLAEFVVEETLRRGLA